MRGHLHRAHAALWRSPARCTRRMGSAGGSGMRGIGSWLRSRRARGKGRSKTRTPNDTPTQPLNGLDAEAKSAPQLTFSSPPAASKTAATTVHPKFPPRFWQRRDAARPFRREQRSRETLAFSVPFPGGRARRPPPRAEARAMSSAQPAPFGDARRPHLARSAQPDTTPWHTPCVMNRLPSQPGSALKSARIGRYSD